MKCFEWIEDMKKIYRQVKAVIRLPIEDGTSGTIIETLSMGRYMIAANTLLPFCSVITNYEEAKLALEQIIEKVEPNTEGSEYVQKNFSTKKLTSELLKIYESI